MRELELADETLRALREEFLLFFSGRERSASDVLSGQVLGTRPATRGARALDRCTSWRAETCAALEAGDLARCGELMNEQWEAKRGRAPGTVTAEMDDAARLARRSRRARRGAARRRRRRLPARLHAADPERTRAALAEAGAPELRFGLDSGGCLALGPEAGQGRGRRRPA